MRVVLCSVFGLILWPQCGFAACEISKSQDLPVTMRGLRPMISAQINGADTQFLLDSGAFYSMMSSATAAQFGLPLSAAPHGLRIVGIGGSTQASVAYVKAFTLAGIHVRNVEFLVGGSEVGNGSAGVLGQNFLELWDVEYDLAKGALRLVKADDCKHVVLAYWAAAAGQSVSAMDISRTTPSEPHTVGTAYINDAKIRVMFDTGASTSMISLKAAARAGVTPDTPGVLNGGYWSGIGRGTLKTYVGHFGSFKIGDGEEIKNAQLRFGDLGLGVDMLIGADFFLSHRVYVANSQHRLFFTYNGGPVFNLKRTAAGVDGVPDPADAGDQPADAETLFRRGSAFAGRGDFQHALADFTRACELNPNEPEYFVQRGMAYWRNRQSGPAMEDFDHALALNRGYLPALTSRAELKLEAGDSAGAAIDLKSADAAAPKQADIRFALARMYGRANMSEAEVEQFDLWISSHSDDSKLPLALNGRCRSRALSGKELAKALEDCNSALRRIDKGNPEYARVLGSRGLVHLRLGAYDKSIADYDAALKVLPKWEWSLYGRGVAKTRLKKPADGEADLVAATDLDPKIADTFAHYGLTP